MINNLMKTKQIKDRHENNLNLGAPSSENLNKIRSRSHSPNAQLNQPSDKSSELAGSFQKNTKNNGRGIGAPGGGKNF